MTETCACGCPQTTHQHYRAGTDCGICGRETCPQYQVSAPPSRWKDWPIWVILTVLAAGWLLSTLLGLTGHQRVVQPPARVGAASSCPAAIDQANAMLHTYALMIVDAAQPSPPWGSLAERQEQITTVDQPAWFAVSEQCRVGR